MEKSNQVRQDNTNLSIYDSVREVPKEAKKEIEAGRLKGKHLCELVDKIDSVIELVEDYDIVIKSIYKGK